MIGWVNGHKDTYSASAAENQILILLVITGRVVSMGVAPPEAMTASINKRSEFIY
jgi:hypothetical protein